MRLYRPRFPIPRYPTGWFQVAWSSDVAVGDVVPIQQFGKELVLFRAEDGSVKVLDAFCPHMGAHLGYGGKAEGDELVCPFHAWRFNGEGACTAIPYATKVPKNAKLECWPVHEVNGLIMVWHDVDHRAPLWELPVLEAFNSDAWSEPVHRQWKFRTHNQEMAENMVDTAHFRYLHGTVSFPDAEVTRDGPVLELRADTKMHTPSGDVDGRIVATAYGFGFSVNLFSGIVDTALIGAVAPIDDEFVDVRFTFAVKKVGGASITKGVGKAFVAEISKQLEQDRPVWEHKVYVDPPMLCDGDGPVGMFRSWSKQFYPDWYRAKAYEAFHGRPMRTRR
jgi:3-ketosteroid 9alpha-monooxygenase subunit A